MPSSTIASILQRDPVLAHIVEKTHATGSWNETRAYVTGPESLKALLHAIEHARTIVRIGIFSWSDDPEGQAVAAAIITLRRKRPEVAIRITIDCLGCFFVGSFPREIIQRSLFLLGTLPRLLWNCLSLGIGPFALARAYRVLENTENFNRLTAQEQQKASELVRRLIDERTLISYSPLLRRMREAGIDVHIAQNALLKLEHSKIIRVDDAIFCGGMNFGTEYFGPMSWKDYLVRVSGGAVLDTERQLRGKSVPRTRSARAAEMAQRSPEEIPVWPLRNQPGRFARKRMKRKQITYAIRILLRTAKRSITIEHAYLSSRGIVQALRSALDRGVSVTLVRSRPENISLEAANEEHFSLLYRLHERLREARLRRELKKASKEHPVLLLIVKSPRIIHSKLLIVDERYVILGSANLSTESLRNHGEHAFLFLLEEGQPAESAPHVLRRALNDSILEAQKHEGPSTKK